MAALQRLGDGDGRSAEGESAGRLTDLAGLLPGLGHQLLLVDDHPVRATSGGEAADRLAVRLVQPVAGVGIDRRAAHVVAATQWWREVAVGAGGKLLGDPLVQLIGLRRT